jgi:branched-chain amino acid transport system substrate-binding protein
VLKIVAANPDAVYIFAAGTPGALPQIELAQPRLQGPRLPDAGRRQQRLPARRRQEPRGQLHDGGAGARRRAAARVEPDAKAAVDFVNRFEKAHGPGSRSLFAATAWDALLIVPAASREALKKAKPGTPSSAPRCATRSRA